MPPRNIQKDIVKSNPGRINLIVEVQTGNAMKKVELPLRLMAIGDFAGREMKTPIVAREPININKDNFDGVLKSLDVQAEYSVPDRLRGGENETKVRLKIESLRDFHPEAVARQVPHLVRLVAARNLLQDLRNRVINTSEFRKGLEQIVRDPAALKQLSSELDQVMSGASDSPRRITTDQEPAV